MKSKKIIFTVTLILAIIWLLPLVLVIINSLKDYTEVINNKAALPSQPIEQGITNIKDILNNENLNFFSSLLDSFIITAISLIMLTITGSMAAWVLVREKRKRSMFIYMTLVASMVVPFQAVMLPLVSWFAKVGNTIGIPLTHSYIGIILAYMGFGAPLTIFMYHSFIKSIPLELEEAATIDGCNKFQIFFKIVFPMLKPVTVTLLILNGMWIWNDYLLPLVLLGQGNDIQTLPLGITFFIGSFVKEWELIMMCLIISIIPVIILFILGQKHILRGISNGAIK